jgi:hypothetical protein
VERVAEDAAAAAAGLQAQLDEVTAAGAAAALEHARLTSNSEVGRCRLTVSKPVLKAPTISKLETKV